MNSEFTIAVHCLVLLFHHPKQMAPSGFIAENVNTHPARVRKVMANLRKVGYLTAKEGTGGGFILNCDIHRVNLAELYRMTSKGSLKPKWSSGNSQDTCPVAANIEDVMEQVYNQAEHHLEAFLETVTIDDIYKQIKQRRAIIC